MKRPGKREWHWDPHTSSKKADTPDRTEHQGGEFIKGSEARERHQGPAHQQQEGGQKLNIKVGSSLKGQRHESDTRDPHTSSRKADRNCKVGSLLKGQGHESDTGTRTPAAGTRTETKHQNNWTSRERIQQRARGTRVTLGPAHQQQEGGHKLNTKVGSSLIKGPRSRERHWDPHTSSRMAKRNCTRELVKGVGGDIRELHTSSTNLERNWTSRYNIF